MMKKRSSRRSYRKIERARREEETRRRITEAAVQLHGTVGPARTTITDLASRAGVSRMTVYNHFPNEIDLFLACSSHWAERNPFPDPAAWITIEDPHKRLETALRELFAWYREKEDMLGKIFRDMAAVPTLQEVMESLWPPYLDRLVDTLAQDWPAGGTAEKSLRAALRLTVDFETWRVLTRSKLNDDQAARLTARMVIKACGP